MVAWSRAVWDTLWEPRPRHVGKCLYLQLVTGIVV